ncbi:MAG: hypothetical protein H7A51_00555 [Akkermansiaceae bacterium]|nr:hypothetical protein [Akkermansiaceae bacterium]
MKAIVLLSVLFPLFFVSCKHTKPAGETEQEKQNTRELHKALRDMQEANEKSFNEDGTISGDNKGIERVIDVAKKMEDSSTEEQAATGKLLRIWMTMMQRDNLEIQNNISLITKGMEYGKIQSAEDIDKLSAMVNEYIKCNNGLTEKIRHGWLSEIRTKAKEENMEDDVILDFVAGLKQGFGKLKPQLLEIRKTDDDLCTAILEQHGVLKKHWGKWQWDEDQGVPSFEEDAAIDAYNAAAQKIQDAADAQAAAQKKVIEIQKTIR